MTEESIESYKDQFRLEEANLDAGESVERVYVLPIKVRTAFVPDSCR